VKKRIRNLIPWLVAAGIFGYLFHHYPPSQIWKSLQYVPLIPFLLFSVGYFFWIYFADVASILYILKRFHYPIRFRELFPVRGVSYLLMILNYAAAQAGFAYYLKRTHKIPIFEVLGFLFFIAIIDIYWIITLAFFGSFFQENIVQNISLNTIIQSMAIFAYALLFLNFLFWHERLSRWIGVRPHWKPIRWLHSKKIFRVFKEASLADYFRFALIRAPIHLTLITSFYILFKIFQINIPFLIVLGKLPIVMLVGVIPITPGGLGTSNMAIVEFFKPYVHGSILETAHVTPSEILFAISLVWMFANYSLKALTGLFCLQKVSRDLFKPTEEISQIEAVPALETPPGFTNPT